MERERLDALQGNERFRCAGTAFKWTTGNGRRGTLLRVGAEPRRILAERERGSFQGWGQGSTRKGDQRGTLLGEGRRINSRNGHEKKSEGRGKG